jgi:uncharacterized protein (DUF952 family)/lysophospholipase L1-like esterase
VPLARYVALGDSQTEGLLDPDGHGGYRGWADRFAELLTAENPHLAYANLAVRGKVTSQIREEQLAAAVAMKPDIATVMGGLNDLLRRGFDVDATVSHLEAMVAALRAEGALVLTNTFPAIEEIAPLLRRVGGRVTALNDGIRELSRRHGAVVVDFAERGVGTDRRIWSPDRIHANSLGHSLIAAAFADAAGLPGHAAWSEPLPPLPVPRSWQRARTEARWVTGTVVPWLVRRARGRSSGDGITAKRPRLLPVAPVFHLVAPGDWPASGRFRPSSLAAEGFVHLSFADQLAATANRHYAEAPELLAVELDAAAIGADVIVEDSYGSGTAFPHAYGPLPVDAALAVRPLRRDAAGRWVADFGPVSRSTAAPGNPTSHRP